MKFSFVRLPLSMRRPMLWQMLTGEGKESARPARRETVVTRDSFPMGRRAALRCLLSLAAWMIPGFPLERAHKKPQGKWPPPRPVKGAGVMTGGAFAPVKGPEGRPITAGGFVDGASWVFADITKQAGLDIFRHRDGGAKKATILEADGSGVALIDYDNDGWLDIYLLNGSTFAALKGSVPAPRAMLLHNNRDGTFTDVTDKAGVANERWGFGVAVGDYDNDGWPDMYVTNFGKNRLYHNNRDGTFSDVAEESGVAVEGWSTGACWGDYDRDGKLDLFVPGYVKFDPDHPFIAGQNGVPADACAFRGAKVFCGPIGLPGEVNHLFHNNGDGTFSDVTAKAGVLNPIGGFGWSSVFLDVDDDGWVDLLVANDSVSNFLYHNNRDGTFKNVSFLSGFAVNGDGRAQASMGIAVGDFNRDGKVDLFITTFSDDNFTLLRNEGDGYFIDATAQAGLLQLTIPFLGWATAFVDYDNDGLLDIFTANGHVYPIVDQFDWGTTYAQRPLLFRNLDGRKFREVAPATGSGLADIIPARGAAFGDLFNDGRIDVIINNIDSTPALLRNVLQNKNHWLGLQLVGGPKSPRDAQGAKVFLTAGGIRQRADVFSGAGYCSSSDQRIHFGLGRSEKVDKLEIDWPSGLKEEIFIPHVDTILRVVEGKGTVQS